MSNTYELVYPDFYSKYSAFHRFTVVTNCGKRTSFPIPIAIRNLNGNFIGFDFIEFESSYLETVCIFHDSQLDISEKDVPKISAIINDIFDFCLKNFPQNPVQALKTYFSDSRADLAYYSLCCDDRSKYRITASWFFSNKRFDANNQMLFDDDLFDERITIQLAWTNEAGEKEAFIGYWSLVSIKSLNAYHFSKDGFYYRRFILLMHFFYKPTVDLALRTVIEELEQVAPIDRRRLVSNFFSILPIECMWSVV